MTTPDPIRAALERLIELDDHPDTECAAWDDAIEAARAALAAPLEGEGPTNEELLEMWHGSDWYNEGATLREFRSIARAVLARWGSPNQEQIGSLLGAAATPPAPLEWEVGELVEFLLTYGDHVMDEYGDVGEHEQLTRAATLLEQLSAAQATQPVAVDGWQPIDTAPKDGTEILASDYDAIEIVSYGEWERGVFGWTNRELEAMFPAWWQPLADHPPLPTTTPAGQEVKL